VKKFKLITLCLILSLQSWGVLQGAGNVFDLSVFKNLTAKIPGGVNNTNIGVSG
jgi:hypothetical protein